MPISDGTKKLTTPDFFIAGAMKCGTTAIHHHLAEHPDVFIPKQELFFYDIDEILEHPDFFIYRDRQWRYRIYKQHSTDSWYENFFPAKKTTGRLIGEDSTTYLSSYRAPGRIALANPDAKIIVVLRNPVQRAWSAYWHLVRYGRATRTFENMLENSPWELIYRGCYKEQIERYLQVFPHEQLHFVVFEEFIQNPVRALNSLVKFLGLPPFVEPPNTIQVKNPGLYPRHPKVQLIWNKFNLPYTKNRLDNVLRGARTNRPFAMRALGKLIKPLIVWQHEAPMQMNPATELMLNDYYASRNAGLATLIGKDLSQWWPRIQESE